MVPEYYIVSLINSSLFSFYVDTFVNNTQTFQINDARQLPIIVPSQEQLVTIKDIFDKAILTKKMSFSQKIDFETAEQELKKCQNALDDLVLNLYGIKI